MATTVAFSELNTWLSNQAANTVDTPYELIITGLTFDNLWESTTSGTLGYILKQNSTKYIKINELQGEDLTLSKDSFSGCTNLIFINMSNFISSTNSINPYAFSGCTGLTSVIIPDNIATIDSFAFYNCSSLTSINLSNSITHFMNSAFRGCSSLTSIDIPNSLLYIGDQVFLGCSSLTSIEIPDTLAYIGQYPFSTCTNLTAINILASPSSIETHKNAFYGISSTCKLYVPSAYLSAWRAITPSEWGLSSIDVFSISITITGPDSIIVKFIGNYTADIDDIAWSTSNSSIATISDGKVTGISAGTVTIIASKDDYYGTKTITIDPLTFKKWIRIE